MTDHLDAKGGAAALASIVAATAGASLYQSLAIIGALAEARVLDPLAVAKWALFFAANLPPGPTPEARQAMREGVEGFAATVRAMATKPLGAGDRTQ